MSEKNPEQPTSGRACVPDINGAFSFQRYFAERRCYDGLQSTYGRGRGFNSGCRVTVFAPRIQVMFTRCVEWPTVVISVAVLVSLVDGKAPPSLLYFRLQYVLHDKLSSRYFSILKSDSLFKQIKLKCVVDHCTEFMNNKDLFNY